MANKEVNTTKPQWLSSTPKVSAKGVGMQKLDQGYKYMMPDNNTAPQTQYSESALGKNAPRLNTVEDMSTLMGGFNYDESRIRGLFDDATKAEYAAKRQANAQGQNQFAANTAGYINTLSDTMRKSLNQAVATGGSRGLIAAQAVQAAKDASSQAITDASKLSQDAINLDYEEAAALAQNKIDAEQLVAERQQQAMQLASQIYGYDVQHAVGWDSAIAGLLGDLGYGRDAAKVNLEGTKYNADMNYKTQLDAAEQSKQVEFVRMMNQLVMNGQASPALRDKLAATFGIDPGSILEAPKNTYTGGSGSYYNGSNPNNTPFDPDKINAEQYATSTTLQKKALAVGNKSNYVGAATTLGYSVADAEAAWETARAVMWQKAQELDRAEYIAWRKAQYGTDQFAGSDWDSWRKNKPIIKSDAATQYNRVQQGVDSLGRIGGYY